LSRPLGDQHRPSCSSEAIGGGMGRRARGLITAIGDNVNTCSRPGNLT